MIETYTRIYLYALTLLSLLMLAGHTLSRLAFHRRALSRRAVLRELVQLLTGALFLPLYISGVIGVWVALVGSWVMLVTGFYAVGYVTKARPPSTDGRA